MGLKLHAKIETCNKHTRNQPDEIVQVYNIYNLRKQLQYDLWMKRNLSQVEVMGWVRRKTYLGKLVLMKLKLIK